MTSYDQGTPVIITEFSISFIDLILEASLYFSGFHTQTTLCFILIFNLFINFVIQ